MDMRDLNSLSRQRFAPEARLDIVIPVAFSDDDIPPPPDEPHPDDIPVASPISTWTKAQHAAARTPIQTRRAPQQHSAPRDEYAGALAEDDDRPSSSFRNQPMYATAERSSLAASRGGGRRAAQEDDFEDVLERKAVGSFYDEDVALLSESEDLDSPLPYRTPTESSLRNGNSVRGSNLQQRNIRYADDSEPESDHARSTARHSRRANGSTRSFRQPQSSDLDTRTSPIRPASQQQLGYVDRSPVRTNVRRNDVDVDDGGGGAVDYNASSPYSASARPPHYTPRASRLGIVSDDGSTTVDDSIASSEADTREMLFKGRPPSDNPLELWALYHCKHVFEERTVQLMSPLQMSSAVDNCFVTARSLKNAQAFRAAKGDVIVCGPPRCGMMGVLLALDVLRTGQERDMTREEAGMCQWIEGAHNHENLQPRDGARLLKTHLCLRTILGDPKAWRQRDCKIVVVLRDPLDARLSHYKQIARIFRAFVPTAQWEYDPDDFAKVPLAAADAIKAGAQQDTTKVDYESYLLDALNAVETSTPNLLVVFYEDWCASPADVIARLSDFTGWGVGKKEVRDIALSRSAYKCPSHPLCRLTSTPPYLVGAGARAFSKEVREMLLDKFDTIVRVRKPQVVSYEKLYERIAGRPWKFSADEPNGKAAKNMKKKKKKKKGGLASFFRWVFRGPDTSQAEEREAFARSQGIKPRKSVSAAQFMGMPDRDLNGNGPALAGPRQSDMSRRSAGSMRSLPGDARRSDMLVVGSRKSGMNVSRTNSKESIAGAYDEDDDL